MRHQYQCVGKARSARPACSDRACSLPQLTAAFQPVGQIVHALACARSTPSCGVAPPQKPAGKQVPHRARCTRAAGGLGAPRQTKAWRTWLSRDGLFETDARGTRSNVQSQAFLGFSCAVSRPWRGDHHRQPQRFQQLGGPRDAQVLDRALLDLVHRGARQASGVWPKRPESNPCRNDGDMAAPSSGLRTCPKPNQNTYLCQIYLTFMDSTT